MVPTTTSRSISVSWDAIDCIERNGEITGYTVEFQRLDASAVTSVTVVNQTFTASGLTPHTNYIFRVAGFNSNGRGPFTAITRLVTREEGILFELLNCFY